MKKITIQNLIGTSNMKTYEGLREDGKWEMFEAEDNEVVTPESTGYEAVRELKN